MLIAAASGALSACGAPRSAAQPAAETPAEPAAETPSGSPSPAAPGTASPTPGLNPLTRDEVVAKYRGVAPARWGLSVPGVITRMGGGGDVVALTFDACGGPSGNGYDRELIRLLRRRQTPATLFLCARWIAVNPGIARELAGDPLFEIANHGTLHRPLSVTGRSAYGIAGTRNPGEVHDEVTGNRLRDLTGHAPRFFRAGTAHYDDVATRIVADLGERIAGFDVNGDAGATYSPEQVARAVLAARPGSIVIAHVNRPAGGTAEGFRVALPKLLGSGLRCVRLSDHIA